MQIKDCLAKYAYLKCDASVFAFLHIGLLFGADVMPDVWFFGEIKTILDSKTLFLTELLVISYA